MAESYVPRPEGPVYCDACAKKGDRVEMESHDQLPSQALEWSRREHTELESFRCPACESVQVFRVD